MEIALSPWDLVLLWAMIHGPVVSPESVETWGPVHYKTREHSGFGFGSRCAHIEGANISLWCSPNFVVFLRYGPVFK